MVLWSQRALFDKVFYLNSRRKCIVLLLGGTRCYSLLNLSWLMMHAPLTFRLIFFIAFIYFFLDNRAKSERCL